MNSKFHRNVLTVLWPGKILDTEDNLKLFSPLFENQISDDSSCSNENYNYIQTLPNVSTKAQHHDRVQ